MNNFFSYIKKNKARIIERFGDPLSFCNALLSDIDTTNLPAGLSKSLSSAEPDDYDYAISSAYTLLIGAERRKELSAYFTPPGLASAVLEAASEFVIERSEPSILDPACGGGSFVTPMARQLIEIERKRGIPTQDACTNVLGRVRGIEIDAGLATLSETLLRKMLRREYAFSRRGPLGVIKHGDTISMSQPRKFDLIVGNPPYGKVHSRVAEKFLKASGRANLGGHTNLYSLFLLRGLDWVKPGGGLVFVVPTSFVAGPYFAGLRHEIFKRAFVEKIDLHEQRENLFLGAVQDICLVVLRRHENTDTALTQTAHPYALGYIDAAGIRHARGTGIARNEGEPWTLPVARQVQAFATRNDSPGNATRKTYTLLEYGYRVRVGKIVPTRERERLHTQRKKGAIPLLWASSIRPDGSFDFEAARRLGNAQWYSPPNKESIVYASTRPAVIVQRTSNRDQNRRLNAAIVPEKFRNDYPEGFVAENHVIFIEALPGQPSLSPSLLVKVLNSSVTNERFSAVSGSFSVSAKLLQRLALPDPKEIKKIHSKHFEHGLRLLFDGLGEVLVRTEPSEFAGNLNNSIDKSHNLDSRGAVDQNPCFQGRTVA